jgi:hypothetical protein
MSRLQCILATIALALVCDTCWAQLYPLPSITPYTNPLNALDVDDNGLVQPRDVVLVINRLDAEADAKTANLDASQTVAVLASAPASPQYYWDTNRDGAITPADALMVINRLNSVSIAPEPSTMVMAGMGLLALFGCAWRRARRSTVVGRSC